MMVHIHMGWPSRMASDIRSQVSGLPPRFSVPDLRVQSAGCRVRVRVDRAGFRRTTADRVHRLRKEHRALKRAERELRREGREREREERHSSRHEDRYRDRDDGRDRHRSDSRRYDDEDDYERRRRQDEDRYGERERERSSRRGWEEERDRRRGGDRDRNGERERERDTDRHRRRDSRSIERERDRDRDRDTRRSTRQDDNAPPVKREYASRSPVSHKRDRSGSPNRHGPGAGADAGGDGRAAPREVEAKSWIVDDDA